MLELLNADQDGVIHAMMTAPDFGEVYSEAIKWMRRPAILASGRYREQQWAADRSDAYHPLVVWEAAFVNRFRKLGIPVYARVFCVSQYEYRLRTREKSDVEPYGWSPHHWGYAVDIVHSTLGFDMPSICWQIFRHVGEDLAEQHGLDVVWGGGLPNPQPEHWEMRNWHDWRYNPPPRQDFDPVVRPLRRPQR